MIGIYTEQDIYHKELISTMTGAGLLPEEEEISLEAYLRETGMML